VRCDPPELLPLKRNRRNLFVDDHIIGSLSAGALQILNQPEKLSANPLISYPWSATARDRPATVDELGIYEGSVHFDATLRIFKMWYMPCTQDWCVTSSVQWRNSIFFRREP
jgi:hypothetical protein